jgi:hypothetical protein
MNEDPNKLNTLYFEDTTMKGLYQTIESWRIENRKRLLSLKIQKDGGLYCCIALTNPTEVTIVGVNVTLPVAITSPLNHLGKVSTTTANDGFL